MESILETIKRYWMRVALSGVHFSDRYRSLNTFYLVPNPWGMESDRERNRFECTNKLIVDNIGDVGTLLEVGCGEGHHSQYLSRVCEQLYGIDVSERAIERARIRCPQGRFFIGALDNARCISELRRFDLAMACEVLYYMQDVPAALSRMSACSSWCFITYHGKQSRYLDPFVITKKNAQSTYIRCGDVTWTAVWWKNP